MKEGLEDGGDEGRGKEGLEEGEDEGVRYEPVFFRDADAGLEVGTILQSSRGNCRDGLAAG